MEKTPQGTYIVDAHQSIIDINKYIPYKFEESEHFETLAGLISEFIEGNECKEGDHLNINEYEVIILKMYRNSAETVELRLLNDDEN
ncbi:Transporter associated domain protein [compost metagenome]